MSTFQYQDKTIYYQLDGTLTEDKDVIVICNGIMMNVHSWDPFVSSFTKDATLLRFDMLDQGLSSKMTTQYELSTQVDVLYHLLLELNITNVHLLGISYGASVAMQFACTHEDYVSKMVLANGVMKTSEWLKAIGEGWNKVGRTRDGEAYYNISIPYIYSPSFYQSNIQWMTDRKQLLIPIFSNPDFLDAMERLTISSYQHDVSKQLSLIEVPTLIISSTDDYLTPSFEQENIHHAMKHSFLVSLPNCGHASMYEQPELFTSLSLGFFRNNQQKII